MNRCNVSIQYTDGSKAQIRQYRGIENHLHAFEKACTYTSKLEVLLQFIVICLA